MHLIQGMWFADSKDSKEVRRMQPWQDVAISGHMHTMFYGMLCQDLKPRRGASQGWMRDPIGVSFLIDIRLEEEFLSFDKAYIDAKGYSHFVFNRSHQSDIWIGEYEFIGEKNAGPADKQKQCGIAWAATTPITKEPFFSPEAFFKLYDEVRFRK